MPSKKAKKMVKVAAKPFGPLCMRCGSEMKTQAQGIGWRSYCCEPCGIGTTEILE